jgi:hypothetical protein
MIESKPSASKGHHFLPQFLLRGFASRGTRKNQYSYLFRKGFDPVETNIKNIGKQAWFHGVSEEDNLEQRLSVREGEFAILLAGLRTGVVDTHQYKQTAAFVNHITIRTKNLRETFAELGNSVFEMLERFFTTDEHRHDFQEGLVRAILKELMDLKMGLAVENLSSEERSILEQGVKELVGKFDFRQFALSQLQIFRANVNFSNIVAESHRKVLGQNDEASNRQQHLESLIWSVHTAAKGSYILGDIGPICLRGSPDAFLNPFELEPSFNAVALPISSDALLVGARIGFQFSESPAAINRASAELRRNFFVASQCTPREDEYQQVLAKRCDFIPRDIDIGKILRD